MIRMIFLAFSLLIATPAVSDASPPLWRINITNVDATAVFAQIEEVWGLTASNPTASCLKENVTFTSSRSWTLNEGEALVQAVMANACCDVEFSGKSFKLTPARIRNDECERVEERVVYGNCEGAVPLSELGNDYLASRANEDTSKPTACASGQQH